MTTNSINFKYLILIIIIWETGCSPQQDIEPTAGSKEYQVNSSQDVVEPALDETADLQALDTSKHTKVPRFKYDSVPAGFTRLPITTLYRYVPSTHARVWNACGVSDRFTNELKSVIDELEKLSFDSDYSQITQRLSTGNLKDDPDAMAILGMLYEQHLVPDVALLAQSDDIAFSLYERSERAGSMLGKYYLGLSHYYGYPSSEKFDPERLSDLLEDIDLASEDSQLLSLKAIALSQNIIEQSPDETQNPYEMREAFFRRAAEVCPADQMASTNLVNFLVEIYGVQSEKGKEGIALLESLDSAVSLEDLGEFYQYGNLSRISGTFSNELVNLPKSVEAFTKSGLGGNPDAAFNIFALYISDDIDASLINRDLAKQMLELAAGLGDWRAMSFLSGYYAEGSVVYEKNLSLALHYSRSLLRMLDTDESISRSDAISEAIAIVGSLLSEENLDSTTLLSGIELTNQLIDLLELDEFVGDAQQLSLAKTSLISLGTAITDKRDGDIHIAKEILATALAALNYGDYYALVIGNNSYEHLTDLESAVADANAVSELLARDYGFKVTQLNNASRSQIVTTLNEFRNTLGVADNFLLYYAGHGQIDPITEEGFWQPVDAEEFDDTNWIGNDRITRTLRGFRSQNILVVADSCYSGVVLRGGNTLQPDFGSLSADYVESLIQSKTRIALTSGGNEPVIDSLEGADNSIFASAFIDALERNEFVTTSSDIYKFVSQQVVSTLSPEGISQTPEFAGLLRSGHEGGDFIFKKAPKL